MNKIGLLFISTSGHSAADTQTEAEEGTNPFFTFLTADAIRANRAVRTPFFENVEAWKR